MLIDPCIYCNTYNVYIYIYISSKTQVRLYRPRLLTVQNWGTKIKIYTDGSTLYMTAQLETWIMWHFFGIMLSRSLGRVYIFLAMVLCRQKSWTSPFSSMHPSTSFVAALLGRSPRKRPSRQVGECTSNFMHIPTCILGRGTWRKILPNIYMLRIFIHTINRFCLVNTNKYIFFAKKRVREVMQLAAAT